MSRHRCEALDCREDRLTLVRCRKRAISMTEVWTDLGYWIRVWVCERHAP